ncbi:chromatin assembly factor 1 subunit FAS1 isoform X2 [Citrus clementina]|uniref:chromatin assembly factor 1 subunit FAS1 isoform X2 n=1 Tax=Citrus clementina TaxID=85681 RepID=UPI000CED5F02|nr:chromatin assembly factor 1 subunit FAS1 isoform X2 [Citrus x clementina]
MADTATMSNVEDRPSKTLKRKRAWSALTGEDKESRIRRLNEEMKGLFGYYKEMITNQRLTIDLSECAGSLNGMVAALMEESELPLTKLVEEIHVKLKENGSEKLGVGLAAVKSAVLFVGQRVMYGVSNADTDILEDDAEASLWCWETRDVKLLPKSVRGSLRIRRTCRKKIHERITAVSASEKLGKVLSEASIRVLVDSTLKKNGAEIVEKDAKREEKILIKQLEKNKREVEKEKKRMDREQQKEKLHSERELKRLQEEAERDERRREKEEADIRKQIRKQQEEADKEKRHREKEEAEMKKKLALQKQASMMERFLKRSKILTSCQNDESSPRAITSVLLSKNSEQLPEAVTKLVDSTLSSNDEINIDDIRRSHLSSWHRFGHFVRSNRNQHWGIRRKPKTELFKELKLTNRGLGHDDDLSMERSEDRCEAQTVDDKSCITSSDSSSAITKCKRWKQLLQFDKSHRPAFYGIWPKKSHIVGPRHPLMKDPDLDYDIDSDEEWEEEEPGESLSDCEKDGDEEGCSKADDEDESEDGFFVPDGYLSEDEGVQVDRMEIDLSAEDTKSSPSYKQELESKESCALVRQRKYLSSLTEQALQKNQPLIILNLMHEKVPLLMAEDLSGTSNMEQKCLQALSIRPFPGDLHVEITVDIMDAENEKDCLSNGKGSTTLISESDLPAIVSVIQSCSTNMNKILEALQQKFPSISRAQLRNKVREISDFNFTENRWQVKREILIELGYSPDKNGGRAKGIATFFSKRCLPPDGKSLNPNEASPLSSLKPGSAVHGQHGCTYNGL